MRTRGWQSRQWHRLRVCRAPRRPQRYHRWINMTLLSGPLPDKHSRINIQIERRECSALETPKGETACTRVSVSCPRRCLDLDVASRQGKFLRRATLSAKSLLIAIAMAPSVDNVFAIRVDERNVDWNERASQDLYLRIVRQRWHKLRRTLRVADIKYTISLTGFVCLP